MSLKNPHMKMSKSHNDPQSRIAINDSPEDIRKKIRLALTDSEDGQTYDAENRPGIANLLDIMAHFDHQEKNATELSIDLGSLSKRAFKDEVANLLIDRLAPIKAKYDDLMRTDRGALLDDLAIQGAAKAQDIADPTMLRVRNGVGL